VGVGYAFGFVFGGELVVQVQAAHVEAELGAQRGKEAEDVVGGLAERVGDEAQYTVAQRAHSLAAGVVARRDGPAVGGLLDRGTPEQEGPVITPRYTKHVADPLALLAELRAAEDAIAEAELAKVLGDLVEVLVVQFTPQRVEEPPEALGAEPGGIVLGECP